MLEAFDVKMSQWARPFCAGICKIFNFIYISNFYILMLS
jgi:hypothetical protein